MVSPPRPMTLPTRFCGTSMISSVAFGSEGVDAPADTEAAEPYTTLPPCCLTASYTPWNGARPSVVLAVSGVVAAGVVVVAGAGAAATGAACKDEQRQDTVSRPTSLNTLPHDKK